MFDDVNKEGKQTQPGGAQEPIDIFSEADVSPTPIAGEIMEEGVKAGFPMKIVAIIVGIVVVLGVVGAGVYFFVLNKPTPEPVPLEEVILEEQPVNEEIPLEEGTVEEQPVNETTTIQNQNGEVVPPPVTSPTESVVPVVPPLNTSITPAVDSDGDGLTDEEEGRYGTDKNVVDTDNDGLSDREEIQVYKTNPVNPDTDGDGFSDGTEVKNGFNPNGPGKLVTVPSEQPAVPVNP